jgi:hypothetical protein
MEFIDNSLGENEEEVADYQIIKHKINQRDKEFKEWI